MTEPIEQGPLGGRFDHVDWRQSAIFGAGAWIVGLILTYVVVGIAGVSDEGLLRRESTFDVAVWIFYESTGGAFEGGEGALRTIAATGYASLDSNFWGAGVVVHYLIPIVVLTVAGFALAGRYERGEIEGVSNPTPVQVAVGGASAGLAFFAAMFLGVLVFSGDASYDTGRLLFVGLFYALAFAALGAGLRAKVRSIASFWGLVGGIGAVVLGFALWYVDEDPLGRRSLSDLSGLTDYLLLLAGYLEETHALHYGDTFPEWYVIVGVAALGAAIVYRSETADWFVGLGRGARLGLGYFLVALAVTLGAYASHMNDRLDHPGVQRAELVTEANELFGATAPRTVFVAGIVWAVVFGGLGGAIGAKVFESQAEDAPSREAPPRGEPAE